MPSRQYLQAHPTPAEIFLAIEFSRSSLAQDTGAKRSACATASIPEYWVVNLRDRQAIVISPRESTLHRAARSSCNAELMEKDSGARQLLRPIAACLRSWGRSRNLAARLW